MCIHRQHYALFDSILCSSNYSATKQHDHLETFLGTIIGCFWPTDINLTKLVTQVIYKCESLFTYCEIQYVLCNYV